ncbi:hypothetical protein DFR54_11829 [Vagococcus fluvialis]|uniref:Type I restriction modification DNA specificity protein n=1 Tax=Vagococcus fluvialis TaxID=2738 RepID=A0A369AQC0_9ENTE|nr:hypothetical protein [Vagococcus fluvialis]RCX10407.1 hypothetical protein DFR54_11829 [Vagococcus fluvialis]RST98662.1 hypothetical protein CBF32_12740 [Vagococcus fluvialis]
MKNNSIIKLNELAEFISGKNNNRLTDTVEEYSIQDFEYDLLHPYKQQGNSSSSKDSSTITPGDIIINLQTGKAAVAGLNSSKKHFPQQFSKIILKKDIPSFYILYLINEDRNFQKEKLIYSTGSVIKRLSNNGLGQCSVKRLPLNEEKTIGDIYINAVNMHTQTIEQANKLLSLNLETLNKYVNSNNSSKEGK